MTERRLSPNHRLRAGPRHFAAAGAVLMVAGILWRWPQLEIEVFARAAAIGASLLTGSPLYRVEQGWLLDTPERATVVSAECSAADYSLAVIALSSWHAHRPRASRAGLGRSFLRFWTAIILALGFTVSINACRVVAVLHFHRWIAPLLPDSYGSFLHQLTGVAVFLPCLIAFHVVLDPERRSRFSSAFARG